MAAISLIITIAGREALINDAQSGTKDRIIVSMGITNIGFVPSESMTTLPYEFKRLTAVAGKPVAADQICMTVSDFSVDEYEVFGFGLYLDDDTLFAVCAYSKPVKKGSAAFTIFQSDILIKDAEIKAEDIAFGSVELTNPNASLTMAGVAKIADPSQVLAMTERGPYIITPSSLKDGVLSLIASEEDIEAKTSGKFIDARILGVALQRYLRPIGDFGISPFRSSQLPFGEYHANGDKYPISSEVGQALLSLPKEYKEDWGVVEKDGMINVPSLYYTDGRAFFPRWGAMPGIIKNDAIRNITGSWSGPIMADHAIDAKGAVFGNSLGTSGVIQKGGSYGLAFDAGRAVPVGDENVPLHITFTPIIYLGV